LLLKKDGCQSGVEKALTETRCQSVSSSQFYTVRKK